MTQDKLDKLAEILRQELLRAQQRARDTSEEERSARAWRDGYIAGIKWAREFLFLMQERD